MKTREGKRYLSDFVGRCCEVTGIYDSSNYYSNQGGMPNKVATLQSVKVTVDEFGSIWLGHCHIQYAAAIMDLHCQQGDVVNFRAEIYSYQKDAKETYGLSSPFDVVVERKARAPSSPPPLPQTTAPVPTVQAPPVQAVVALGKTEIKLVVGLMKQLGIETILSVLEVQGKVGGDKNLNEIIELLS